MNLNETDIKESIEAADQTGNCDQESSTGSLFDLKNIYTINNCPPGSIIDIGT